MLSEKKVSKKSPSKTKISSVLEQIGLLSRGKSEHMLTPEGGGIAERPLTATNTYNIRRSRTSLMFRLLPTTASCGGLGAKPPEARVQGRCSCWVWAKTTVLAGFRPRWSRGSSTCRRLFLLIHYAEISLSRSGRIFSENLHPTLDNIRLLSRSEDRG